MTKALELPAVTTAEIDAMRPKALAEWVAKYHHHIRGDLERERVFHYALDQHEANEAERQEEMVFMRRAAFNGVPTAQQAMQPGFRANGRDGGTDQDLALAGWVRNAFGAPVRPEEFDAAHRLGMDPRSRGFEINLPLIRPTLGRAASFSAANQATTPGDLGGYTIPGSFVPNLEVAMKAFGPMLRTSEIMTTEDGRRMNWPTLDDATAEGVQLGENVQVSEDALTFGSVIFDAYKFSSKMLRVPYELLRDSGVVLAAELGKALGMRLGRIVNRRATTGNAAATMKGITVAATTGVTAGSATAITFDELINLQASVDPAYRDQPGVGWMMHSDTAAVVQRLKDGDGRYIWQNNQMQAGQPPLLLGQPVNINQHMDGVATGKTSVLFGDLSHYKLRLVGKVRLLTLVERYADFDQTGFIAFWAADGNLLTPSSTAALCPVRKLVHP